MERRTSHPSIIPEWPAIGGTGRLTWVMSQLLERITPPELWEGFEKLSEHRPDLKTLLYILGRPRIFEWIHSVGVSAEDKLRALVPPVPPEELRQITAAPETEVFLWTGLVDVLRCLELYERHRCLSPVST